MQRCYSSKAQKPWCRAFTETYPVYLESYTITQKLIEGQNFSEFLRPHFFSNKTKDEPLFLIVYHVFSFERIRTICVQCCRQRRCCSDYTAQPSFVFSPLFAVMGYLSNATHGPKNTLDLGRTLRLADFHRKIQHKRPDLHAARGNRPVL